MTIVMIMMKSISEMIKNMLTAILIMSRIIITTKLVKTIMIISIIMKLNIT